MTLTNHNSPETAYVIADYPYGFRLRCQMRCWIETTKHGQRYVTQTSNPKRPGLVWNKPKASTYSDLKVMWTDDNGHVHNAGFSITYSDEAKLEQFLAQYGEALTDEYSLKVIRTARAIFQTRKHFTVKVVSPEEAETPAEKAETDATLKTIFHHYLAQQN